MGISVSIVLFFITYKQTIGAKKERIKAASLSIHRAILRRLVLEDYAPKFKDISRVIEGKAREFRVSNNDLFSEDEVLNSLYTEVFDNDLIPPSQRLHIETRLDELFKEIEHETPRISITDYEEITQEKKKKVEAITLLIMTVSTGGAIASLIPKLLEMGTFQYEWLLSGLGVFIISVLATSALSLFRKTKDSIDTPSRSRSHLKATKLENEIAKILQKANVKYTIEPSIGRFRPDFRVETKNKTIVIEAKAWSEVIPLSVIKQTIRILSELSLNEGIDKVVLVTKKRIPLHLIGNVNNDKISIININELSNFIKDLG